MKYLRKHISAIPVILLIILSVGCKKEKGTAPVVLSLSAANITASTATSGGSIINDGSTPVSLSGVCWSTVPNPTIQDSKTTDGSRIGKYISSITGLTPGTTYFLRSYATNAAGTSYSNETSFITTEPGSTVTDIDGNIYGIITIGSQVWMKDNLRTTRYSNGDLIGTTPPSSLNINIAYDSLIKYQWAYDGNENLVSRYGRLYTWWAAVDRRNVCPAGWHLPDDTEWTTLTNYLADKGYGFGDNKDFLAKSIAAPTDWYLSGQKGSAADDLSSNNTSGFSGLPAGYRESFGSFKYFARVCHWWSATQNKYGAYQRALFYDYPAINSFSDPKAYAYSVRCLKD